MTIGLATPAPKRSRSSLSPRYAPKTLMRLADIEDALASGKSEGRVMHEMHERHGIQARQCRRLMALARARWAREASATGREQRRDQLRTAAWTTYRAAMGREKAFPTQAWNDEAKKMESKLEYVRDPDAGAAVRALEFLARLDGDLTQPGPTQGGFGEDAFTALHVHLYGVPPPKDVAAKVVDAVAESDEPKALKG